MDYLARENADLSAGLWEDIDTTVVETLKEHLVARRFLKISGPYGVGTTYVELDGVDKEEVLKDGIARVKGRTQLELPILFEDFSLLGRDLEYADQCGRALDLTSAMRAAKIAASREDDLVLLGNKTLGTEGLITAKGAHKIKRGDWKKDEIAYLDIIKGISYFSDAGYLGRYALVLSTDLFVAIQRLAPNTGLLEIDRVKKIIGDHVYTYSNFGTGKALLVCSEPEYMDLAVGLDFSVGYAELVDFNHHFRIMESVALRIKDPGSIIVFD